MYALIHSFPGMTQPTSVALAGPCPQRPWAAGQRGNLNTLAEQRVR
jgi:hypothetical protein